MVIDPNKDKDKLAPVNDGGSLAERHKTSGSKLHQRVAAAAPLAEVAKQVTQAPPINPQRSSNPYDSALEMPNRIGLMLDCSGSMNEAADERRAFSRQGKTKLDYLKEACQDFVKNCDFSTTAIAIETFPSVNEEDDEKEYRPPQDANDPLAHLLPPPVSIPKPHHRGAKRMQGLCNVESFITADIDSLQTYGSTPMAQAMDRSLTRNALTRGVLVSDGDADNPQAALASAHQWKDAELQVDCVHIGHSTGGEELLQKIAKLTGGMYIKFDNVENFAKHFKYLTPAYRAMLTSGSAGLLGAKEVK